MSQFPNRAALWLNKLAPNAPLMSGLCPSVQVADGQINGENVRFIAVVRLGTDSLFILPGKKLFNLRGIRLLAGIELAQATQIIVIVVAAGAQHRSDNYDDYLRRLSQFDTRQQADTAQIKQLFAREDK